ncbi:transposase [Salipaludibacillus sp. HK11]|uniref:transposase n=1 Tax=Salipaludibacillus sp. HK11 TaxID=3394320 RepID=UPI0039FC18E2
MPRKARRKSKTGIYHMVLRGINKQVIFEEKEDSQQFLRTLIKYKEKSNYTIYAYCLMGNHIHILIKEGEETLGMAMRRIGASYVYWYNWKYDRVGHLFQDRYISEVVEDKRYLLTALRYIHHNPLKAGIVEDLQDYQWSSFTEYSLENEKIVDIDFILNLFHSDRRRAILRFERYHQVESERKCLDVNEISRMKDSEAISVIKNICNIAHSTDIQKLDKERRDKYIKEIKEKGLSTRQISRLTGISRHIVLNV